MASDYEGKTVIQLKGMCRENGLPVSGTKKVLIDRLTKADESLETTPPSSQIIRQVVPKKKIIEIQCLECQTILRVPADYEGMISCPSCLTKQSALRPGTDDTSPQIKSNTHLGNEEFAFGLTKQQFSIGMMLVGVGVILFGIWLALMEWNLWFSCESWFGAAVSGGDYDSMGCGQGTFFPTMFTSCCLLVPLGFFLATYGYNLIQTPAVTPQVHYGAVEYPAPTTSTPLPTVNVQPHAQPQVKGSPLGGAIQATAVGLSVGVASVMTIIGIIIALIFLLFIMIVATY
ncbi:MAG: SAP domain-containing protein [Candidatus Poseidoniaceae archaeon]|nr:SAP domain-containing protein [Candidatus Poseidoniaceae archaeon]